MTTPAIRARLVDHLDKGASLGPQAPALVCEGETWSYADVVDLSHRIAAALARRGAGRGSKVAILSANDPIAFSCVFGISRADAVWCPINPRNEASENAELLDLFECEVLIFSSAFAPMVESIWPQLPGVHTLVCLDAEPADPVADWALTWTDFLGPDSPGAESLGAESLGAESLGADARPIAGDDAAALGPTTEAAMIVGTGGTTGRPKGVMLTGTNLETMSAITLMAYPWPAPGERPVYLALAPLTHAAGVLCFPVMDRGGSIVVMRSPDVAGFLRHVEEHRVTHTFLPPTLIYMVLDHPNLAGTDLSSLQCFWYGAAPMSTQRLAEALEKVGPVMAQLFGQTEAPMMISALAPADHFRPDGSVATERLGSAGWPTPLVQVQVMGEDGRLMSHGERGEIVVRSSLVMAGYWKNPEATAEASAYGWHHTGDIGYLDDEGLLFIVDRAKDMVITGGFNVYSTEVEQAVMAHEAVADCAVIGLPDDKWGERVTAVVQLRPGAALDPADLKAFVKERIGAVKSPKQVEVWDDLPRSKVGKVLKTDIKARLQ